MCCRSAVQLEKTNPLASQLHIVSAQRFADQSIMPSAQRLFLFSVVVDILMIFRPQVEQLCLITGLGSILSSPVQTLIMSLFIVVWTLSLYRRISAQDRALFHSLCDEAGLYWPCCPNVSNKRERERERGEGGRCVCKVIERCMSVCVRKRKKKKKKEKKKKKKKPAHKLVPCHSVFFIPRDNLNFSIEKKALFHVIIILSLPSSSLEAVGW